VLVISVGRFGGPEMLVPASAPDPVAGPGEVVVAASASDVLFVDTMIRSGRGVGRFPIRPPYVPGGGVVGALLLSPYVEPGTVDTTAFDDFSLLRSIAMLLGVAPPGYAAQKNLRYFGAKVFDGPGPATSNTATTG